MCEVLRKTKNNNICLNVKANSFCWYIRDMIIKYQDLRLSFVIIIISKSFGFKTVLQSSQFKLIIHSVCFEKCNMIRFENLHSRSLMHLVFEYNSWILSFFNNRDTLYQRNSLLTAESSHILSLFIFWNDNFHFLCDSHHHIFFIHVMNILFFNSILCNVIVHQLKSDLYNIRIFSSNMIFLKFSNEFWL